MTVEEKKRLLSVCTVPAPLFDTSRRTLWGLPDESGSAFYCCTEPLLINGGKDYAPQLESIVRVFLENEYFGELPNIDAICATLDNLVGQTGATDIYKFCSWKWDKIRREEAKDRAAAWLARHNILDEIDRINPDSLYMYFYDVCGKSFERERDCVFVYGFQMGYETGLAVARKGAQE